jgi:hypothetical protein
MENKNLQALLVAFVVLQLAACGGGNNASTTTATSVPMTVDVQTAVANLITNGLSGSFTASGWDVSSTDTVSGSGTYTESAGTATTLNGENVYAQSLVVNASVTVNGTSATLSTSATLYRDATTYAPVAENDGTFYIAWTSSAYPTTVQAGSTGTDANGAIYSDATMTTQIGTVTETYTVSADTSTSLLLTFTQIQYNTSNAQTVEAQTTYSVTTSGALSLVSAVEQNTGAAGSAGGTSPFDLTYTF